MLNFRQSSILVILIGCLISGGRTELFDMDFDDDDHENISMKKNESFASNSTIHSISSKKLLSTKHGLLNKLIHSNFSSLSIMSKKPLTMTTLRNKTLSAAPSLPPYMIARYLLDQFNKYRHIDIISRIKQCDSKMRLHDMCEAYSIDNHSYSLIREPSIEFQSLKQLYDALVDRMMVHKLSESCPIDRWCLTNLTQSDIRFTLDVLRQRGRSLCALERCTHRLSVHATSCPLISPKNISIPTLKLLPMLCALYSEQQIWNTPECIHDIVYLLHTLYAFWPKLEMCHHASTDGTGGCRPECLMFDTIFHQVENRCNQIGSIFSRVPALAWYRLISLKQICGHDGNSNRSAFVSSVENFISTNLFWYRLHQRPVFAIVFILAIICIVISFSLCLYMMSKTDSNSRRLDDDDYEYTRLHDSTYDIAANTENGNNNSASTRILNENQFDLNGHQRISEHQRLIYNES